MTDMSKEVTAQSVMKLALEALESYKNFTEDAHVIEGQWHWLDGTDKAVTAIKQALAAPVQEPLAWMTQARNFVHVMEFTEAEAKLYGWMPLYTTPPNVATPLAAQRQWVGLTDEQIGKAWAVADGEHNASASVKRRITRAIEAAHGITGETE